MRGHLTGLILIGGKREKEDDLRPLLRCPRLSWHFSLTQSKSNRPGQQQLDLYLEDVFAIELSSAEVASSSKS